MLAVVVAVLREQEATPVQCGECELVLGSPRAGPGRAWPGRAGPGRAESGLYQISLAKPGLCLHFVCLNYVPTTQCPPQLVISIFQLCSVMCTV